MNQKEKQKDRFYTPSINKILESRNLNRNSVDSDFLHYQLNSIDN